MKKADFHYWLECLDKELLAIGAEKFVHRIGFKGELDGHTTDIPAVPGYRFNTQYGPLELHPDIPFRMSYQSSHSKLRYGCTVYGRFKGDTWPGKGAGQPNPKWNFCLGERERAGVMDCATHVATRVAMLGLVAPYTHEQLMNDKTTNYVNRPEAFRG